MIKNILTMAISLIVSVLLAEGAVRLVLDPVDYLQVEWNDDPVLGIALAPGSAGHDGWGFRNRGVPDSTDIIAIGDSMTYGVMAKSTEAWPIVAGQMAGTSVYSASLGGYGPLQYLHLLRTRAPELNPKAAVIMFYLGNDLMDSYNLAYGKEAWASYRTDIDGFAPAESNFQPLERREHWSQPIRNWLATRSILYRLVTQSPLFNFVRERETLQSTDTLVQVDYQDQTYILDPEGRSLITDTEDPRIQAALGIFKTALSDIAAEAKAQGIALHAALMPVREQVFLAVAGDQLGGRTDFQKLDADLKILEAEVFAAFEAEGIPYTDLRPVLEAALADQPIYTPVDGHPNAAGYAVAAEVLAPVLSDLAGSN